MEMALPATKDLGAELAVRERILSLEELIMATLLSLGRSLMRSSQFTSIVDAILARQCRYHALPASHRVTETDGFTGVPGVSVLVHQKRHQNPGHSLTLINGCTLSRFYISNPDGLWCSAHF